MKIKIAPVSREIWIIAAILIVSIIIRLYGIGFGLPGLYDPDEPLFVLIALDLLRGKTLNPHWFGHPGTMTFYALAIIDMSLYLFGHWAGWYPTSAAFGQAVYANPTLVFLPGRVFIALCGVICVFLTFSIGRRLFDDRIGLIAAGLLALTPIHVQFSQIIRTDMQSSVFMLLCVLWSINIAQKARILDYIMAGVLVGLSCATKWPAVAILICPLTVCLMRALADPRERRSSIRGAVIICCVSVVSLLLVSPYLVLDYQTVMGNLHGEARLHHPGATGGGFFANLYWYISEPLWNSEGIVGLILAAVGLGLVTRHHRLASAVIVPVIVVFFVLICKQALIWSRWIVPLMPFISLLIAVAIAALGQLVGRLQGKRVGWAVQALLCTILATTMLWTVHREATERLNDTRDLASQWTHQHIPLGHSIVVEHVAADLMRKRWPFFFPAGTAGCVDAAKALTGKVRFSSIDKWQNGRSVIDLGTMDPSKFDTCRAEFAIISHYDRYAAEQSIYAKEVANYRIFLKGATLLATFRPVAGKIGGPVITIYRLNQPRKANL